MKFIFLSYLNRSGSTYLANLLSKSPEICVCPEAEVLYELLLVNPGCLVGAASAVKLEHLLERDKKLNHWKISFKNLIDPNKSNFSNFLAVLERYRQTHYKQASYILFKQNYLINLFNYNLLTNCYWINLIRDPRGVYASQKSTISPFTKRPMARNVLAFSDSWNILADKIAQIQDKSGTITLQYEDLIGRTDAIMDSLTLQLNLKELWVDFNQKPSKLIQWISLEYLVIHPFIDDLPKTGSIAKWQRIIPKSELQVLQSKIIPNKFYPQIEGLKPGWNIILYIFILRIDRKITNLKALIKKNLQSIFRIC